MHLAREDDPNVPLIGDALNESVTRLRAESGKDIWLSGGGSLFRSLLDPGLVDTVVVAVIPILLGAGRLLLPPTGSGPRCGLAPEQSVREDGDRGARVRRREGCLTGKAT